MKVRKIMASSQQKLPHPNVDYAAISSMANITADLYDEDDPAECFRQLQAIADAAVDAHLERAIAKMRQQPRPPAPAEKAAAATAEMSARLAAKHGGR